VSGTKIIRFDARDFCKLLTSYSEGRLPLDFELDHVGVDTILTRQICFIGRSKQWQDDPLPSGGFGPLMLRYEGQRMMSWGQKGKDPFYSDVEIPRYQG
jgi:hypothetical protein